MSGTMYRDMMVSLQKWKDSLYRKPLLLKGIRQCGKTFLLKQFGDLYFEDVAYFNFEGNEPLQERFKTDMDAKRIVNELGVMRRKAIVPGKTLLIFDEIQACGSALTSLKLPELHIACAGSLIGLALSQPHSFPVGKVDFLTLHPMSFHEFLLANDEEQLCDYLSALSRQETVSPLFISKLEGYLCSYYITGGMPSVVARWIATHDIQLVEEELQRILTGYELDFARHAPAVDAPKISMIWNSIPQQLSKENRKFIFSHVRQGLRAKDLEDAFQWLCDAGLAYRIRMVSKPGIPLSAYADETYFKLYLSDIGLLRRMARVPAEALFEKNDSYKEFKGAQTENFVLCELMSMNKDLPYYWTSGNRAEIDFIIQSGMQVVPIEVKSEKNERTKRLSAYRNSYSPPVSIVTSLNNVSGKEIRHIPLYLLWKLDTYLQPSH